MLTNELLDGPFALETEALVKRYGSVAALAGVDLRVPDGAVYVLVGENGAGKSTLIRSLMHLVRADQGRARVQGLDVGTRGPEVRAQIGYVPERHDLDYRATTVARLVDHHRAFYPSWDAAYATRLAQAFDIRSDSKCGALSKGESRRVQLLLALAHRPPVLLLDEPADGLDHAARDRTLALLVEHLADAPTTVLISTHRIHDFEPLVDHLGALVGGVLFAQTSRERLQRMLRRYLADVPEGWEPPPELSASILRRSGFGREIEWTIWGEQAEVLARLSESVAVVRQVRSLSLDEAAATLLSMKERP